jgi:hypothetical protein
MRGAKAPMLALPGSRGRNDGESSQCCEAFEFANHEQRKKDGGNLTLEVNRPSRSTGAEQRREKFSKKVHG